MKGDIETLQGQCSRVEFCLRLNDMLPPEQKWKICPKSGIVDRLILLSEEALSQILKGLDLGISDWTTNSPKGTLLQSLFGNDLGRKYELVSSETDDGRYILHNTI